MKIMISFIALLLVSTVMGHRETSSVEEHRKKNLNRQNLQPTVEMIRVKIPQNQCRSIIIERLKLFSIPMLHHH